MTSIDYNRIIARAAKSVLAPLDCRQQGRSRIWLDDHGWWVTVVEFQPSQWSKGSGLNVGVCWLWYEKDYLSYSYSTNSFGPQIESFHEFAGTQEFESIATSLAQSARLEVLELRRRLQSVADAAAAIEAALDTLSPIWRDYDAGVAAGLIGNVERAADHFRKVKKATHDFAWVHELKHRAAGLVGLLADGERFRREIDAVIARTRDRLKLPRLPGPALGD